MLSLFVVWKENLKFSKTLKKTLLIWTLYNIVLLFQFREVHSLFFLIYVAKFIAAYVLIRQFGVELLWKYEKAIYILAIISLFFWVWQSIHPSSILSLFHTIDIDGSTLAGMEDSHFFVYSINIYDSILPRNCGFTWEPGPFSIFIDIALFINLFRTNFELKKNKIFWVLIVTLLTTQSTTGLVGFLMILFWLSTNKRNLKLLRYPIILITLIFVVVVIYETPYLREKVIDEYSQIYSYEEIITISISAETKSGPGRFASFLITWEDFKNYPFLGYGGHTAARWTDQLGAQIFAVSGIGKIISRYGLFGTIIFSYFLIISSRFYARRFNYKFSSIWTLLIISFGFGFGVIESPMIVTLIVFPLFLKNEEIINSKR